MQCSRATNNKNPTPPTKEDTDSRGKKQESRLRTKQRRSQKKLESREICRKGSPKKDPLESSEETAKIAADEAQSHKWREKKDQAKTNAARWTPQHQEPPPTSIPMCVRVRVACYLIFVSSRKRERERGEERKKLSIKRQKFPEPEPDK